MDTISDAFMLPMYLWPWNTVTHYIAYKCELSTTIPSVFGTWLWL